MGGILCKEEDLFPRELVTATKLTSQFEWSSSFDHPLKHLELSQQDIEDKSKADWLLKGLAMFQILWLVLNVAVREKTGLPITQLEISTVAFAVMAVLTYIANWWKPKDISQPTYMSQTCRGSCNSTPRLRQLSVWLHSPKEAISSTTCERLHRGDRVPNDVTWMKADTSSIAAFLAVTSLVFGGIHCIAWNFEFPSRAELMAWRIGCVITAVLPTVTLTISILLSHLSTEYFDTQCQKVFLEEFNKFPSPSSDWWNHILNPHLFLDSRQKLDSFIDSIPGGSGFWSHEVSEEAMRKAKLASFQNTYADIRCLQKDALKGQLRGFEISNWMDAFCCICIYWNELPPKVAEAWKRLEIHASGSSNTGSHQNLNSAPVEQVLRACDTVNDKLTKEVMSFQATVLTASRLLSILSYVAYLVARLLTILLFLTSLRSVPADVYQVTSWVSLLLKIS